MTTLNTSKYTIDEIVKLYARKELAQVLVATTCYDETLQQQYREFKTKISMVEYLMQWLDSCADDGYEVEDIIQFIDINKTTPIERLKETKKMKKNFSVGDRVTWISPFTKRKFSCIISNLKRKDHLIKIIPDKDGSLPLTYNHFYVEENDLTFCKI